MFFQDYLPPLLLHPDPYRLASLSSQSVCHYYDHQSSSNCINLRTVIYSLFSLFAQLWGRGRNKQTVSITNDYSIVPRLATLAGYNAQIQLRYNDPLSSTENYTWSTICHFLCYSSDPLLAAVRVHRSLKLSHSSPLLHTKSALFRKVSCLSRPCLISESWFQILSSSYVSNIFIAIYKQILSQVYRSQLCIPIFSSS